MFRLYSVNGLAILSVAAMRFRRLSWAVGFLGFTLVPVDAQQEPVPSFRAQSEVVLVGLPLEQVRRAHELLEAGDVFGKIVLRPGPETA